MSLPTFATQTVTLLRPATLNDHGDVVPDWSQTPTSIPLPGVSVSPPRRRGVENAHEVTTEFMIFAPLDADLRDTDRIVYKGTTYAIRGEVLRYETGVLDHIEAYLTTITAVA